MCAGGGGRGGRSQSEASAACPGLQRAQAFGAGFDRKGPFVESLCDGFGRLFVPERTQKGPTEEEGEEGGGGDRGSSEE